MWNRVCWEREDWKTSKFWNSHWVGATNRVYSCGGLLGGSRTDVDAYRGGVILDVPRNNTTITLVWCHEL